MQELKDWVPVFFNLIVAAFIYGGLYVQVRNSKEDITAIQADDKEQWKKLDNHGERLSGLEARSGQRVNGVTN